MTKSTKATASKSAAAKTSKATKKAPHKSKSGLAKKPANKAATKKATAKKAKPAKKVTSPVDRTGSNGLRKSQIKILLFLAKQASPKTRKEICSKGKIRQNSFGKHAGLVDESKRLASDSKYGESLFTRKLISLSVEDRDGKSIVVYTATKKGKVLSTKI
jgi:hypothetical protein